MSSPKVLCRLPGSSDEEDIEDLLWWFLLESFESKSVWVISPWITHFNLSREVLYHPYVASSDVIKILENLSKYAEVNVLVRCIDDFVSPDVVYTAYEIYNSILGGGLKLKDIAIVAEYFNSKLDDILKRLSSMEKLARLNINLKTDLKTDMSLIHRKVPPRLHAKLYINDKFALVGSANLTYHGMSRSGNWECMLMFKNGDGVYERLKEYAEKLFKRGHSFNDCVQSVIKVVNESLKPFNVELKSLDDFRELLTLVQRVLKEASY